MTRRLALPAAAVAAVGALLAAAQLPASADRSRSATLTFVRDPSIYELSLVTGRIAPVLPGLRNDSYAEHYSDPAWSGDGRRLAVTDLSEALREGNSESATWIFSPPKAESRLVSLISGWGSQPSWAPDRQRLVLDAWDGGNTSTVVVWNPNAKDPFDERTLVSDAPLSPAPAWSPDGSRIAWVRGSGSRARLYLVRPDGKGTKRVTSSRAGHPSWSPDGRRLVFDTGRRIAVVDADGRHLRFLTGPGTTDTDPAWSPDGRSIAFARRRGRTDDLWLMSANGGNQRLLVRNASQPAWRPRERQSGCGYPHRQMHAPLTAA